jgi:hypothetical protein
MTSSSADAYASKRASISPNVSAVRDGAIAIQSLRK